MNTLTITDESATGTILQKLSIQFESEYITVSELIEARIKEEIRKYETEFQSYKHGLVIPTNLEQRLNKKSTPKIDLEKQFYVALDAFKKNGFFILVDDEQVEDLNQKVHIDETSRVSFIKLTPLVGG